MKRLEFVVQRIGKGVVVLIGILILNFVLIRLAPGDPAAVIAGEAGAADALYMQQLRERFGLDRTVLEQLWIYLSNAARFDLGFSYRQGRPVIDILLERLPATLLLTGTAYVLSLIAGLTLGILAAIRVGRWTDSVITVLALFFYATPLFWVGLMGILLFSVTLGWLPSYGMYSIGARLTGFAYVVDVARHLILPAVTLALFHMAFYARMTRASILEVRDLDFVRTARAKGLPAGIVLMRHALRNALIPVVTVIGLYLGLVVGNSVLIEIVFNRPGLGKLIVLSLTQRDYTMLQGLIVVYALFIVLANLITDLSYGLLDPRVKHQ